MSTTFRCFFRHWHDGVTVYKKSVGDPRYRDLQEDFDCGEEFDVESSLRRELEQSVGHAQCETCLDLNLDEKTNYKTINTDFLSQDDVMIVQQERVSSKTIILPPSLKGNFRLKDVYLRLELSEDFDDDPLLERTILNNVLCFIDGYSEMNLYFETLLKGKIKMKPAPGILFFRLLNFENDVRASTSEPIHVGISLLSSRVMHVFESRSDLFAVYVRCPEIYISSKLLWDRRQAFTLLSCRVKPRKSENESFNIFDVEPAACDHHQVYVWNQLAMIIISVEGSKEDDGYPHVKSITCGNITWPIEDMVVKEDRWHVHYFFVFDRKYQTKEGVLKMLSGESTFFDVTYLMGCVFWSFECSREKHQIIVRGLGC